jgi:hypothetical protein
MEPPMILLPTTATLDAIVARLWPSLRGWHDFCRFALRNHYSPKLGIPASGPSDTRTLADAFDLAMRAEGSPLRATRLAV